MREQKLAWLKRIISAFGVCDFCVRNPNCKKCLPTVFPREKMAALAKYF